MSSGHATRFMTTVRMARQRGLLCRDRNIHYARARRRSHGFPHYVLELRKCVQGSRLNRRISPTAIWGGHAGALHIRCNETGQVQDLLTTAKDLDADCMATGHIHPTQDGPDGAELHCALMQQDQSYFLFSTTPEAARLFAAFHWATSLQERPRSALPRNTASALRTNRDSQDICFVPNANYAS